MRKNSFILSLVALVSSCWITGCYYDKQVTAPVTEVNACPDTTSSYATAIKPIIDVNCVVCHNGPTAPRGLDYTTYQGLKNVATTGRLIGAITHATGYTPMPFNRPKLSDCAIAQIKKWVDRGAPNN